MEEGEKERSHDPRIVLKSVAREEPPPEPLRLRSVGRPVQKARKRAADIKELLVAAKKDWDRCDFEGRVRMQGLLRKHLPRGSISESLKKKAGLAEACSSCDERVTKYRPLVRRRVLRRFSGPELRKRVEEALASRGKPAKEPEQEEEEEEEGDPGSEPDFGRSPAGIQGAMALDPAQLSQQLAETINAVRGLQGRLESQEQELQTLRVQARRPPTESDLELGPVGPPGLGSSHWPAQAPAAEAQRGLVDTRQLLSRTGPLCWRPTCAA